MNLEPLIADLRGIIVQAQGHAARSVNTLQVASNYCIGQISQTPSGKLTDEKFQTLSGKSESSNFPSQRGSLSSPGQNHEKPSRNLVPSTKGAPYVSPGQRLGSINPQTH
jgi:hypothetical protein